MYTGEGKFTDETSKEEWKNILTLSCMSSDESAFDDEILIIWVSDNASEETTKSKSPQAK